MPFLLPGSEVISQLASLTSVSDGGGLVMHVDRELSNSIECLFAFAPIRP